MIAQNPQYNHDFESLELRYHRMLQIMEFGGNVDEQKFQNIHNQLLERKTLEMVWEN